MLHNVRCKWTGILIISVLPIGSSRAADAKASYGFGKQQLVFGDFAAAIKCFDQAIQADHKHKSAYRCRAFAQILSGNPNAAIDDFTAALQIDSNDPVLYYGRGSGYRLLGKNRQAIADFTEALRLAPEYWGASMARSMVYAESGDRRFFVDPCEPISADLILKGGPDILREYTHLPEGKRFDLETLLVYRSWSILFREYRALRGLWNTLGAALRKNPPDDAKANRESAVLDAVERRLDKSVARLDRAVRLAPDDPKAYELRGAVFAIKRDLKAALADITKAIELNPRDVELYGYRSSIYLEMGDSKKSLADMRKAVTLGEHSLEDIKTGRKR